MTLYHFGEESLLDDVFFVTNDKGGVRGYLHTSKDPSADEMQSIVSSLNKKGYDTIPITVDGKPLLEVRGADKMPKLMKALEDAGAVSGKAEVSRPEKGDNRLLDKIKERSLWLSGVAYLIGDYGFFKYNMKETDQLGMIGAFCYFLGTLSLVGYGRNDQSDLQVRDFAKDLKSYVDSKGVPLHDESCLHDLSHEDQQSLMHKMDELLHRYPSEAFNLATAAAGAFVAASAYHGKIAAPVKAGMDARAISEMRQEGWWDLGLGTITTASGLLATFVKEKKPDPDEEPKHGLAWLKQKIQEHPLAISGVGYTTATLCHATSTVKAWKEAKRVNDVERLASVPNRALFVLMALTSEALLTISSKGHGDGVTSDHSVHQTIYAVAAELIAKQPEKDHEPLIKEIAGFLEKPDVLAEKRSVVEQELRKQIAGLQQNPWLCTNAQEVPITEKGEGMIKVVRTSTDVSDARKKHEKEKVPGTMVAPSSLSQSRSNEVQTGF